MNKYFSTILISLCAIITLCSCSSLEKRTINPPRPGDLSYRDLMLKDYEQMLTSVRKHIRYAKQDFAAADEDPGAEKAAFNQLEQALQLIFSRPDSDNSVAKLVPEVRRELALYDAYYKIVNDLARKGIQAFDRSLGVNTVTLATYTFMLQNLLGEIQVEARTNKQLRSTIQMIADANIKVPPDVIQERKLSGMFLSESPSSQAKRILKSLETSQN